MSLTTQPQRIGLIAGNGRFPLLFAQIAKKHQPLEIVAVAIKGDTSRRIGQYVDKLSWAGAGQLGVMLDFFKQERITQVVMAGQVNPNHLFNSRLLLDEESQQLFDNLRDRRADTIFLAVAQRLKTAGIALVDPTPYLKSLMPQAGVLTRRQPTQDEWEDIRFGKEVAKTIGAVDIGQTVVIKGKAILAIEAMEGTDRTILRGGAIGRSNIVVVKTSKPRQDMRFDVPVVGLRTILFLMKAKASCLAIEADKTLFLDKDKSIALANRSRISIVAV